jgi:Trypsin-like peptidase domain
MNGNIRDSIVKITSSDPKLKDIGTGFVIHQDEGITYVLTCAHVVSDLGDRRDVPVNVKNYPAKTVSNGRYGYDLAVLEVEGGLTQLPALKLSAVGEEGREFNIYGYFKSAGVPRLEYLKGTLGSAGRIEDDAPSWNLEISEDSKHKLKPGYSGSPVIDKSSGYVLGVVSQGEESDGLAISIEALKKVWKEMPDNLIYIEKFMNLPPIDQSEYSNKSENWLQNKIDRISKDIKGEKAEDEYLTDKIHKLKEVLRHVPSGEDKMTIQMQLERAIKERDTCFERLENLEDQVDVINKELNKK